MPRKIHCVVVIAVLTQLLACASQPDAGDVPAGVDFKTQMLADGTKLFKVITRESIPNERRGLNKPPEQRRERPQDMKKIAEAMLAENRYCRSGFVVLEQYQQQHSHVLRGECRDAADASDRQRFAN